MRTICAVALTCSLFATPAHGLAGGSYVKVAHFPSEVAFVLPKTPTKEHCTAVTVARATFLTAAHCFDSYAASGRKSDIVFYKNEFVAYDRPSILHAVSLKIVGRPQIYPTYYLASGFLDYIKSYFVAAPVDLAVFKVDRDIEDSPPAPLFPLDVRAGLPLIIGGFGPPNAGGNCDAAPCPLRMGVAKVASLDVDVAVLPMTDDQSAFLTPGDSGGPAFLATKNANGIALSVVGINRASLGISNPNTLKTAVITLLRPHLHWINKAIHDVNFGT